MWRQAAIGQSPLASPPLHSTSKDPRLAICQGVRSGASFTDQQHSGLPLTQPLLTGLRA